MEVAFNKGKKRSYNFSCFKNINSLFYYALLLFVIGLGFYFLMLLTNGFTLAYGGDYSGQYIPMGYHIWDYYHELFAKGHINEFDFSLYLGSSTVNSNAYYGLYSPFNILLVIFPRSCVPYVMAIASIIKIMCAGLFFRMYIKSFGTKEITARIAGIGYAFVGWMAFYLWYNNYQDTYVFFPLLLLGIEKILKDKKPWIAATAVFLLTISNYVLMVTYVICGAVYAVFRYFQTIKNRKLNDNVSIIGIGIGAFLLGLLMSCTILVPAFLSTMKSPKLSGNIYWESIKLAIEEKNYGLAISYLFDWSKATDQHGTAISIRAYYPILNFFFPATTNRSMATLEYTASSGGWDFDDLSCSLWIYVPNIILLLPAIIDSIKNRKVSHIIALLLLTLSLCTPIMYYLFIGGVNAYARWTLFVTASLLTYTALFLDKYPNINKKTLHFGLIFALLGVGACWFLTLYLPTHYSEAGSRGQVISRFIYNGFDFTNIAFGLELAYVIGLYILLYFSFNTKRFLTVIFSALCFEAVLMGNFVTLGHGYDTTYNNGYSLNNELHSLVSNIKNTDKNFYRIYTSTNDAYSTNNGLMNGYSSASYFHSLYNFNVDNFTLWTKLRSGHSSVGGTYRGKIQDLDTMLGIKYYIIDKRDNKSKYNLINKYYPNNFRANVPLNFEEVPELETETFKVYENKTCNDFGYSYSYIYNYNNEGETEATNIKSPNTYSDYYIIYNSVNFESTAILSYEDTMEVNKLTNNEVQIQKIKDVPINEHLLSIDGYSNNPTAKYVVQFYKTEGYGKEYDISKIPSIPTTLEKTTYEEIDPMKYFAFITKKDGEPFEYFDQGQSLYIYARFSGSEKYDVYLIDEDNKIFLYDDHDDHSTDNPSPIRGFYNKDKKIKAIAYCGKYGESNGTLRVSIEEGSKYLSRMKTMNEYPITDVTYKNDTFTFKTNYSNYRFIQSKIAFDNGWHLYKTKDNKTEEIKIYNSTGGFVGFIAEPGECSYKLEYSTPYIKEGRYISSAAYFVFFTSLFAYQYYTFEKKYAFNKKFER